MVWVKNPTWWAIKALSLSVQPTYIVDIVNDVRRLDAEAQGLDRPPGRVLDPDMRSWAAVL